MNGRKSGWPDNISVRDRGAKWFLLFIVYGFVNWPKSHPAPPPRPHPEFTIYPYHRYHLYRRNPERRRSGGQAGFPDQRSVGYGAASRSFRSPERQAARRPVSSFRNPMTLQRIQSVGSFTRLYICSVVLNLPFYWYVVYFVVSVIFGLRVNDL